jgi:preprotein translocase subunit SecD
MVDDENSANPTVMEQALPRPACPWVPNSLSNVVARPLLLKKQVVLTGDRLTDAQPGFDGQTQEPAVHLTLDCRRRTHFPAKSRGRASASAWPSC